jgi:ABC-2 type transport system permease protein
MKNFNVNRFKAITRKEFIHVLRDWRSLYLSIAIPLILITLFGYALDMDIDNVPVVIWDQSKTPESREFIDLFHGSPYFSIKRYYDNYDDIERSLANSSAVLALIIPSEFSKNILTNQPAKVQMIADGSDPNTARLALAYASSIGMLYSQNLAVERMNQIGISGYKGPLEIQARAWFNPDLKSRFNLIPGIIVIVLIVIAAKLTSVTVAKEWEIGTMEQLISTPIRGAELVFGKVFPYFIIGIVDVALSVYLGQWLFKVPLRGNTALLFLMASIFLLGALFFGITISITLKKQVLSNQVALLASYLPTMLLSGFVFAIENMAPWIQCITYIVPARYFLAILRGIYLKGIGLEILWLNAILLTFYMFIMIILANKKIKLKLG